VRPATHEYKSSSAGVPKQKGRPLLSDVCIGLEIRARGDAGRNHKAEG